MDDREAIAHYDRAGEAAAGRWPPVRWPDLALTPENMARLVEGVLDERCDCARLAFGDDFDASAVAGRLTEAWRTDDVALRFAPEGVFIRAAFTVRVEIAPEDAEETEHPHGELAEARARGLTDEDEAVVETLGFDVEVCVSFTSRHHTRPFVDFMGGTVRRTGDGAVTRLDPFAREIAPADAVAWGLNGAKADGS